MYNGNDLMTFGDDSNLLNNKIYENNSNLKNYHYLKSHKNEHSFDIIRRDDKRNIINIKNNRSNSHKKDNKRQLPNLLYNIDLNTLFAYSPKDEEKNKKFQSKTKEKRDISPEKYLEDILTGDENNMLISFEKKENDYIMNKSSKEFDMLKNTLFNNKINGNKLSKSLQIMNKNKFRNNNDINKIENEASFDKAKIMNHDDIPIVVNNINFVDLLEKELANEKFYNLKYNNKSFNLSQIKNSSNLMEKSLDNQQNILNQKENYDRDDYDNKGKIKFSKLLNDKKNNLFDMRSRTPDNLSFKRNNKKKIFKNNIIKNLNNNNNTHKIKTDIGKTNIKKENISNNNIIHNNNFVNPFQQKKIKNIINNNSITIISHFDIEENSIKKNPDITNSNNNLENKDLNDSADNDITNYMCEEEKEKEKEKKELELQKKINELNYEINKYKEERNNLKKTKMLYEKLKSKLEVDIGIFHKQKEEFKNLMINEIEKVKIKQHKYKSNNKIIKNLKNENEILTRKNQENKEIIESLKNQIFELQNKTKIIYNNFSNKKNYKYKFQLIEEKEKKNNNSFLRQYLNNKTEVNSHREKLIRNRSSLGMTKNKDDKTDIKRLNTFMTEKELYSMGQNTKEDEESFQNLNTNKEQNKNINNNETKHYNIKTYELKNYSNKNNQSNINHHKNENREDNNIITKEKYNNILKLINKSFKKNNRNTTDKSNIEKTNHTEIEKKKILFKCKSNININSNRNKINLKQKNLLKKPINYNDKNPNLTTNKKVNSNKEKKLSLEEYEFKIPEKYKNNKYKLTKTLKAGDKIINIYNDSKKEIIFQSGVRKEIFKDGLQIIYFVNGDIKQNYPNGKSIYYFSQAKTVQTTYKNGIIVVKFDNNQVERHYPDGKKQILFPDGSEKTIYNNGNDKSIYSEENSINNE